MNAARFVTGWAEVRVTGAEPEAFLNAAAERGIVFWDAEPPKDYSLRMKVPYRTAKRLPALGQALSCEVEIVQTRGIPAFLAGFRRRKLLAVCLFLMLLLLVESNAYIWEIGIEGNETVPDGVILQALEECGVKIGARWLDFSQDGIRNGVILRVPELRWMTVTVRGGHAEVIVRERRMPPETVPEGEYAAIVAEKAGLITEVNACRGTALVSRNQAVLPGETLIGGYTTGRFGVQGPVRAIGEVWARTWYEITAEAPKNLAWKQYSGEKTSRFALIFGKNRVNFYKGSSICPADCDKIISTYTLSWPGVFTLPIALEKTEFISYETEEQPAAELREELESALMERLLLCVGEEGEILSSSFTASGDDNLLYVTLRAECSESIGTTVPLDENELLELQSKIP